MPWWALHGFMLCAPAGSGGGASEAELTRLETALAAARDEAGRLRQLAAAAKREAEAGGEEAAAAALRAERLEGQVRQSR
jgi:hypothetical protein